MAQIEFTDHDFHVLHSLENLHMLRDVMAGHAEWLHEEWGQVSDDPMPFFEVHDIEGRMLLVFVLRELSLTSGEVK